MKEKVMTNDKYAAEVIENREALQYLLEQEVVFINYREHSFEDTKPVSYTHLTLPTKRIV